MADWLEPAVAADAAEGHRNAKHLALQNLIRECEQQIGGATLNLDGVLSSLADDLPELIEEARPAVARLKGARTASEAITLGVAEEWKTLAALRKRYDQIQAAQTATLAGDERSGQVDGGTPSRCDGVRTSAAIAMKNASCRGGTAI
jgi:hypothetical protein